MTAKDLLNKVLDYNYLWSLPERKNSKPAKIRLSQIEVLQDALGLSKKYVNPLVQIKYSFAGEKQKLNRAKQLNKLTNLEYLLQGEFLFDREKDENLELQKKIITTITSLYPDMEEYINLRPIDIHWLFKDLINFRQEVYRLTYPNEGMLEGFSAGLHYSFYLKAELKKIIKYNLAEIDETLWQILDPTKKVLNKAEINYPEADLERIDSAWSMENY
ncbi:MULTISPECIES: hypothetical protein [unclassified Pedobacter]|uniref:hypothetical protein n=1 Tax=unclassified Pedobacter TaxID=2628915 RepID=UPI00141DF81E|nr:MULTISPECIES: hypothetical protein [unclassified Pedobacter]NII83876.1 hypothetical protein [Pedobacter sp. SG908]NMN37750.1 hypothetical protein [Pedobacter sp. SG918]